jgi:hypothetical protein
MLDAPVGQGLHHEVTDRSNVGFRFRKTHVDAVIADIDIEGLDPVVVARRLAGDRIVVPSVPRTPQKPVLDRSLTERPTLVGAVIVEGAIPSLVAGHAQGAVETGNGLDPALRKVVRVEYLGPNEFFAF